MRTDLPLLTNPVNPDNPLVFLDVAIGDERVGRMVIELRKDVVPKTAENFRCLCTGEKGLGTMGKPLHYKGIKFHKVQRIFMAQGGDIVKNTGVAGESIYGPTFEDENFELTHQQGVLSMANYGRPHSNNSQFVITSVESTHLDGSNVVFGRVIRGFGIIAEMEKYADDEAVPFANIVISDCGEIVSGDDWGFCDNDETADKLPPFPDDWRDRDEMFEVNDYKNILLSIKAAGNQLYAKKDFVNSCRKYKKSIRYYNYIMDKLAKKLPKSVDSAATAPLEEFHLKTQLNLAAGELKLKNYVNVKHACDEVLKADTHSAKALYRRGQAETELKNYDEALQDLSAALRLVPNNKKVIEALNVAKKYWKDYNKSQQIAYKDLFKRI